MDREQERRFVRIESKVNLIAKAISWILTLAFGFGAFLLSGNNDWAPIYGFGAAIIAGSAFEWRMRVLEKRFPYDADDSN
jgi:hypothetical protein